MFIGGAKCLPECRLDFMSKEITNFKMFQQN